MLPFATNSYLQENSLSGEVDGEVKKTPVVEFHVKNHKKMIKIIGLGLLEYRLAKVSCPSIYCFIYLTLLRQFTF